MIFLFVESICKFKSIAKNNNTKVVVTPEEQYVQCMDAAYAAADRETCLKMMRRAEGVLRGEFSTQPTSDGPGERALAN